MSWLYSQALVAEYSVATCSDGEQSAPSNGNPTPQAYLSPDRMTEFSRLFRFGMTCEPLTGSLGEDLLTWYLEGFRAKTSALQEPGKDLTASVAGCGQRWPASFARFDPDTCSWKTAQHSLLGGLDEFSETWPRWGMTRNLDAFQRQTAGRHTSVTGSGLWPTPNVPNGGRSCAHVTDWRGAGGRTAYHNGKKVQVGLEHAAKYWPTATATAYKGWSPNHNRADTDDRLDYSVERLSFSPGQQTPQKRLNPVWVEWLMGWPQGWTDLKPLEMDKFREWRRQHSIF